MATFMCLLLSCGSKGSEENSDVKKDSISEEIINEIEEIDSLSVEISNEAKNLDSQVDEILKGLED